MDKLFQTCQPNKTSKFYPTTIYLYPSHQTSPNFTNVLVTKIPTASWLSQGQMCYSDSMWPTMWLC